MLVREVLVGRAGLGRPDVTGEVGVRDGGVDRAVLAEQRGAELVVREAGVDAPDGAVPLAVARYDATNTLGGNGVGVVIQFGKDEASRSRRPLC